MIIVVCRMNTNEKEAILEEVEFNGTVQGLYELLSSDDDTKGYHNDERILHIDDDYAYLSIEDVNPYNFCRINNKYCDENKIAFFGLSQILGTKEALSKRYLEKQVLHRTKENPDILTEQELKLEQLKQEEWHQSWV